MIDQTSQANSQCKNSNLISFSCFSPTFTFSIHLHLPTPKNRTCCATTCILMSPCGQRNVATTSEQNPELKHHCPSNTSQSWKADVFHVNPSSVRVQAGGIFHRIKVMYMSSPQDFPLGFSVGKAMQHDPTACTYWLPLVVCISAFKTTLREAEGGGNESEEDWKHPCTYANFQNRLLRSAKHLQDHQGHVEQVTGNMLWMPWETVWRWKNFGPPHLGSEEKLPLALPQTQLISNIMEAQMSFSQGQGGK